MLCLMTLLPKKRKKTNWKKVVKEHFHRKMRQLSVNTFSCVLTNLTVSCSFFGRKCQNLKFCAFDLCHKTTIFLFCSTVSLKTFATKDQERHFSKYVCFQEKRWWCNSYSFNYTLQPTRYKSKKTILVKFVPLCCALFGLFSCTFHTNNSQLKNKHVFT